MMQDTHTIPGFGRLPAADTRDRTYLMRSVLPAMQPPPAYRYWRTGKVLDQGAEPHCVGYAWRQWLSSAPLMTRSGMDAPAIYHAAQRVDEWPGEDYDGTSVRAGAKVLAAAGHIASYLWAFDMPTVRDFVLLRGSVVLGTDWYRGMLSTDQEGYVAPNGALVGGHAYLCIGYSSERQAFRCVNSWGSGWGQQGRFWLRAADLDRLLAAQGEACTAIEQRQTT